MANPEHVEIVKQGTEAINEWRKANLDEQLDLSGEDLLDVVLTGARLSCANFSEADLSEAQLMSANLRQANFSGADLNSADLCGADLCGADLTGAVLHYADLRQTDLGHAKLRAANLRCSDLSEAELVHANLCDADLHDANLSGTDCSMANLSGAILYRTNLSRSNLHNTKGILLDETDIRDARFSPNAPDPWSILRQTYTGPQFAFVFVFATVALIPYIASIVFWLAVGRLEERAIPLAATAIADIQTKVLEIKPEGYPLIASERTRAAWLSRSQKLLPIIRERGEVTPYMISESIALLSEEPNLYPVAPTERADQARQVLRLFRPDGEVKQRRIWQLILGQGWQMVLVVMLGAYTSGRFLLTYFVGPLREEEARSGWSPTWKNHGAGLDDVSWRNGCIPKRVRGWFSGYRWLYRVHQVMRVLFWIAIVSGLVQLWSVLTTQVLVPA